MSDNTDQAANSEIKGPLLIVDDDAPFRAQITRAMERRGFEVTSVESCAEAKKAASSGDFSYAIVDMRLEDGNGLELVPKLRASCPHIRIVMLTGYGNLASAVASIKEGAVDYLAKPAEPNDVANALLDNEEGRPPPPENPMSADRVRWEHIQRVYELCDRNVSETARRLNMHRRTLQRILAKRSPR